MDTIFNGSRNEVDRTLGASARSTEEVVAESQKQSTFSCRQEKILKEICKMLKKKNKLLKKAIKLQSAEKDNAKKSGKEEKCNAKEEGKSVQEERNKETKGFFREFGKAICKAIPSVLTIVTTAIVGFFFNNKGGKRWGMQGA